MVPRLQSPTATRNGEQVEASPSRRVSWLIARASTKTRVTSVKSFDIRNRIDQFGVEGTRFDAGCARRLYADSHNSRRFPSLGPTFCPPFGSGSHLILLANLF